MLTVFRFGELRNFRLSRNLIAVAFVLFASILAGCVSSSRPQVASITFTTDLTGATAICTTANISETSSGAPLCTSALLPSLTAGGSAVYLYADVLHDDEDLGVIWTVTCGSATSAGSGGPDTSCGTFAAAQNTAQTLSGPIPPYPTTGIVTPYNPPLLLPKGGAVTITAHAMSLPSETSSVTLPVAAK